MRSRSHLPGLVLGSVLLVALGLWGAGAITGAGGASPVPTRGEAERASDAATLETGAVEAGEPGRMRLEGATRPADEVDDVPLLRGRLHQQETGEPLPWYHLELRGHKHTRLVQTDAEGRFELPFPEGHLFVTFHDVEPLLVERASISFLDLEQREQVEHRAGAEPLRLEVSCGPTFDLDLPLPEGVQVGTLWGELTWRRSEGVGSPIWYEPLIAPLRTDGGGTWLRFLTPDSGSRNGPWSLAVHTYDEFWRSAESQTERVQGRYPRVLPIELLARGWLTVRARHGGVQETRPVIPLISPIERPPIEVHDGGVVLLRHGAAHALDDGWLFTQLEAGPYLVTFESALHETYTARVEVEAHQHTEHDAELVRLEIGGAVEGTLMSRRGDPQPARTMHLAPEGGGGYPRVAQIDWHEAGGGSVGSFRFEDVPVGKYELSPDARTLHAWSPSSLAVEPPFEGAHFERLDDGPHGPVGFLVYDENGVEITADGLSVAIRRQSDPPEAASRHMITSGKPHHLEFPLEAPVEWIVELPGHEPVLGRTADFSHVRATSFGECRFAEVVLRRRN